MTETYKTTYLKGMNTRPKPNVNNSPNGTVSYGEEVVVVDTFKATADGVNVKKNDTWVRIEGEVEKWVAVVHLGKVYGELFKDEAPPPVEPPVPTFPEYFILTDPQGNTQRFNKA